MDICDNKVCTGLLEIFYQIEAHMANPLNCNGDTVQAVFTKPVSDARLDACENPEGCVRARITGGIVTAF